MKLLCLMLAILLLVACGEPVRRPPEPENRAPPEQPLALRDELSKEERLRQVEELRTNHHIDFHLGKGDVLAVSVYNEPDLSVSGLPIRPDGMISFPLIGDVQAEGLPVQALADRITEELSRYVKAPKVSVIVQQFVSLEYTIVGEVTRPGVYPIDTDVTITKAVARAGGLTKGQFHASSVELADLQHSFVSRDNRVLPVDFVALLRRGDLRYDIPLQPGDYIYIPSGLSQEIYVLGEVGRPDLFAFREGLSLSKALAIARGFTPDADLEEIHLVRGALQDPDLYIIDYEQVLAGTVADVELRPGDIIYVPPTGLTEYARVVDKLMPTIQAMQVMLLLHKTVNE
jgi:polysaccharide export outer membrane protein